MAPKLNHTIVWCRGIHERKLDHWADPTLSQAGEINHNDGGRGVYRNEPDGHLLEVITRPYGSGDEVARRLSGS
jgi:hypothetical protein